AILARFMVSPCRIGFQSPAGLESYPTTALPNMRILLIRYCHRGPLAGLWIPAPLSFAAPANIAPAPAGDVPTPSAPATEPLINSSRCLRRETAQGTGVSEAPASSVKARSEAVARGPN